MMLVPRKLVPAVEAIVRSDTSAATQRGDTRLRAASDLSRILNIAKRLAPADGHENQARLRRAVSELANLRLTDSDLLVIREVLSEFTKARHNPREASQGLRDAARKLTNLRNRAAHRVSQSAPLPAVRPAYSLDEDADA